MSVDTEVSSIEYAGNNSTSTAYTIPFPFLETTDIKCQVKPLHGEYEELDADAFTVIRDGDGEGGTLTTATAVATLGAVYIYRDVPLVQPAEFPLGGLLPSTTVEQALDRVTMVAQQIQRESTRALRLRADIDPISPTDSVFFGFDSSGEFKLYTPEELRDAVDGLAGDNTGNSKTWADDTARLAVEPDFIGQLGVQRDDSSIWYGYALGGSYWTRYLYFKSWATADDRNSTTPDGPNQIGIQASDNTLWVSNLDLDDPGTLWKPYNHGPTLFEDQDEVDAATPNYVNELAINGASNALLRATALTPGAWALVNTSRAIPLAVTARSPFDVPGLILACNPHSTVTKDGSDRCTQWNDLSGNGNHLTQATAANGPVVIAASGSIPRLMRFDNTKSMDFPSLSMSQAGTIIAVGKKTAAASNQNVFISNSSGSLYFGFSRTDSAAPDYVGFSTSWGISQRKPYVAGNLGVACLSWQYEAETTSASGTPFLRVNGGVNGIHGTGAGFGAADLTPKVLGGASGISSYRLNGDLYEVYVWDRRLSDQELCDVEAYLANLRTVSQYSRQASIICEGDSLTYGQGVSFGSDYPNVMLSSLGLNYAGANLGIGATVIGDGSNAADMCRRAPISVDKWAAENNVLVFWAGTNDVALSGASAATVLARLWAYVAARKAAGWKRIVIGTPSYRGAGTWTTLSDIRTGILAGAQANGVVVADIGGDTNFDSTPNAAYYSDSVHFSTSGYAYAAGLFKAAVQQALAIP